MSCADGCWRRASGSSRLESRENAFLHVSAMSSGEVPKIGSVVFARIIVDESHADAGSRAVESHSLKAWRERRARLRAATVAVQAAKAAKLAAVFTQRAEQSVKELLPMPPGLATGTVAQSIGVDTFDQNDTGRTAKEQYGKAMTGPGVWGVDQDVSRGLAGHLRERRARGGGSSGRWRGRWGKGNPRKGKPSCRARRRRPSQRTTRTSGCSGCGGPKRRGMRMMIMRASIRLDRVLAAACSRKAFVPYLARQNADGGISMEEGLLRPALQG